MRDVTLVILNSLRIKCHIRRPLISDREDVEVGYGPNSKKLGCSTGIFFKSRSPIIVLNLHTKQRLCP